MSDSESQSKGLVKISMKIYSRTCKCGSNDFFHETKNSAMTGLYCSECGKWQKWLSSDEIRAFKHSESKGMTYVPTEKMEVTTKNELELNLNQLKERIRRYYEYCGKSINSEYSKMPLSVEDSIRKNAKCYQLELDKTALLNILEGREFNDNGGE